MKSKGIFSCHFDNHVNFYERDGFFSKPNSSCNIRKCTCSIIVMAFDFTKFRKLNVNWTVNFALHLIDQLSAAISFTIVLDEIVPKMQLCAKAV